MSFLYNLAVYTDDYDALLNELNANNISVPSGNGLSMNCPIKVYNIPPLSVFMLNFVLFV